MLESDEDRLEMIKSLGGLVIEHADGGFWAYFDREYIQPFGAVESKSTAITARTIDVEHLPKDTVLKVPGNGDWKLKRHEPDGNGMSVVHLRQ